MKIDFPALESPPDPFKYKKAIPQNQIANLALSPGFVDTRVVRGPNWLESFYGVIGRAVGASPEEGASKARCSPASRRSRRAGRSSVTQPRPTSCGGAPNRH